MYNIETVFHTVMVSLQMTHSDILGQMTLQIVPGCLNLIVLAISLNLCLADVVISAELFLWSVKKQGDNSEASSVCWEAQDVVFSS